MIKTKESFKYVKNWKNQMKSLLDTATFFRHQKEFWKLVQIKFLSKDISQDKKDKNYKNRG